MIAADLNGRIVRREARLLPSLRERYLVLSPLFLVPSEKDQTLQRLLAVQTRKKLCL